jgi:hypothetical protein
MMEFVRNSHWLYNYNEEAEEEEEEEDEDDWHEVVSELGDMSLLVRTLFFGVKYLNVFRSTSGYLSYLVKSLCTDVAYKNHVTICGMVSKRVWTLTLRFGVSDWINLKLSRFSLMALFHLFIWGQLSKYYVGMRKNKCIII